MNITEVRAAVRSILVIVFIVNELVVYILLTNEKGKTFGGDVTFLIMWP